MKKLIVMGIVAGMVMGLAGMASAAPDADWAVSLRAEYMNKSANTAKFGLKTGASDAYVAGQDATHTIPSGDYALAYSLPADAPAGSVVKNDLRAPLPDVGGATMIWDIFLRASSGSVGAPANVVLKGYIFSSTSDKYDGGFRSIALQQGGVTLVDDAGNAMVFAAGVTGTSTAPTFTKTFAFTGQDIPIQLVAVVPEPGSMLAMFSGLVGLVGYGIRRRK
jgi:hypothetical protein